ncbi:MAG: mechanosensitive ion channel family protein [Parvularculales bacterium]
MRLRQGFISLGIFDVIQDFQNIVYDIWTEGVFGYDIGAFLIALGVLVAFIIFRGLITRFVLNRLEALVKRTETSLDDALLEALRDPVRMAILVIGLFFAINIMPLEGVANEIANKIVRSLVVWAIFWGLYSLIDPLIRVTRLLNNILTNETRYLVSMTMRVFVAALGGATILSVWGINVAPLIAGLGVGGLAVALGAQDLFKNLVGGISILLEKRFRIGDWVFVDGIVEGTVEKLGYRSTLIRRFDLAPVYVPNNYLADNAVTNFSAMTHRRIYWKIGVVYETGVDQLRQIRDNIETYILNNDAFEKPPAVSTFVRIDSFSESSIDIMVYCFTKTTVWGEWLAIKEALAYKIKEIVKESGSGFAFPSRSVYVESMPHGTPASFADPAKQGGDQ